MGYPLEPDSQQMNEMGRSAAAFVADFIERLERAPADGRSRDTSVRKKLNRSPSDEACDFDELLDLFATAAQLAVETAGPRFMAYIPGGGLFSSALAEFLARSVNRFTGTHDIAPELIAMETSILQWLCAEFELPSSAAGIITTGGSIATLTAIVAARSRMLGDDFAAGTIYITEHSHHCISKAAYIAGFTPDRVRCVPTDSDLRMDVSAAEELIARDRAAGYRPFFMVANAGSTDSGTIDPIRELGQLAGRQHLWFHVDGAYGGFFQLTLQGRDALAGIGAADSIVLDPHKGLFLPYGTGVLLVRDPSVLQAAFSGYGHYLQDMVTSHELPNFSSLGPELTGEFRGLRLWLPLNLHGVSAFRAALEEKLALAAYAFRSLSADSLLDVPWVPDLFNGGISPARPRQGGQRGQRGQQEVPAAAELVRQDVYIQHYHPWPGLAAALRAFA